MPQPLPIIYIYVNGHWGRGVIGVALAEDGTCLTGHMSSNIDFFRHDMGLTSSRKHEKYHEHYPNGYQLVEVEEPGKHAGLQAALEINRKAGDVE